MFSNGPHIVTDGLVLCLDAGDKISYPGSGTTWSDLSGNGYDGTLTGGPTFSSDNAGSIVFDGTDDYNQITSDGFGKFNIQTWSIEAWVKPDNTASGDHVIFSYDYTSHTTPYYATHMRFSSPGKVYLMWNNGSGYQSVKTSNNTFTSGVWYHIVGVFESGRQEIFVNGQSVASSTLNHTISFFNQEVWIGRANYGGYFDGNINIVKHYNKALTAAEISQNFNAQRSRFGV